MDQLYWTRKVYNVNGDSLIYVLVGFCSDFNSLSEYHKYYVSAAEQKSTLDCRQCERLFYN